METTPVLHEDDPAAVFTRDDGHVVRNLSAAEYAASYADGDPHKEGPDNLEELVAQLVEGIADPHRGGAMAWMPAYSFGGPYGPGLPLGVAVHSTESDNGPSVAEAIAGPGWFGGAAAGTSAHKIADQNSIVEGVRRNTVAWALGPGGNGLYLSYEFCGRAGWSPAQWRAPENLAMLALAAPHIADDLQACGATAAWLSLAQIGQRQRGLLSHNDVRLVWGGTTHSDPGPSFPYGELLTYVRAALGMGGPQPIPSPPGGGIPGVPGLPAWPASHMPPHNYFGLITGPNESHGGGVAWEKPFVQAAQHRLVAKGYVPGQRDWRSGWSDSIFGPETAAAVARFQHAEMRNTTLFGQLWSDDWAQLAR